nr:MAG TPA: distal tail protein [Caudoviricetes sp.]
MFYCIYNNVDSRGLGLQIERLPPRVRAKPRYDTVTIPGRSGNLTVTDGTYDTFTRSVDFVVHDLSRVIEICAAYTGTGWLTFGDEPDKRYKARAYAELRPEWLTPKWRRLSVSFECQPFAYELYPQSVSLTNTIVLHNIGTFPAQPIMNINRSGTGNVVLTVNGAAFTIYNVPGTAVIDCENLLAYAGTSALITAGEYPKLQLGGNTLSISGGTAEIQPNWRWL